MQITLYTKPDCPGSHQTRLALKRRGIPFHEYHARGPTPFVEVSVGEEPLAWLGHREDLLALLVDLYKTGPVTDLTRLRLMTWDALILTSLQVLKVIEQHQRDPRGFFEARGTQPLHRAIDLQQWLNR